MVVSQISQFNLHDLENAATLKLPELENFTYGILDDVVSAEESQLSTDIEHEQDIGKDNDDVWVSSSFGKFDAPHKNAGTWEQFYDKTFKEKQLYLSEASPEIWDAAWLHIESRSENDQGEQPAKQAEIYPRNFVVTGLFELALGFSSALFRFNGGKACTRANFISSSGLSTELTAGLIQDFGEIGQLFHSIHDFIREIYKEPASYPSTVAAAAVIEEVVESLKTCLLLMSTRPASILQLQETFRRPKLMLTRSSALIKRIKSSVRDVEVLEEVYSFVEGFESIDPWFRPVALLILQRIAKPYLQAMNGKLGLGPGQQSNSSIDIQLEWLFRVDLDDATKSQLLEHDLPSFLVHEQKELFINTTQDLEMLKVHDEENILVRNQSEFCNDGTLLEMVFGWDDIERIQSKAMAHEENVRKALVDGPLPYKTNTAVRRDECFQGTASSIAYTDGQTAEQFFRSYKFFDALPGDTGSGRRTELLRQVIEHALLSTDYDEKPSDFLPPLSMACAASFHPVLSAQSRLVNHACLKMLFHKYNLLHHLELQHQFQLLGCGIFSARLSQALFSSTLPSAERRKGHARSGVMGLRMGLRETWPPASAELRLALMGILSECYQTAFPGRPSYESDDLPGNLSFAIRNLSEPEIQACLDSKSLQALDFLRLQYRPSPPLDAIISEAALDKYDRIFRLQMRLCRVSFAATHFFRTHGRALKIKSGKAFVILTRFHVEARHFVHSLTLYIHSCISSLWTRFYRILKSLAHSLESRPEHVSEHDGLYQLKTLHEAMLDQLLFDLLLRNRQEKVMELLVDILGNILEFTQLSGLEEQKDETLVEEVMALFTAFREKTKLFIAVCKRLSEKGAYKVGKSRDLESMMFTHDWKVSESHFEGIESLVMMLDINGWYQKQTSLSLG
ncbi:MAG: hypothetical protein LQ340_004653 [Diploschistes diacapsis]|nr:MAG: hypothetical protein LQ340_004653 [Diploschistes diacapsis]